MINNYRYCDIDIDINIIMSFIFRLNSLSIQIVYFQFFPNISHYNIIDEVHIMEIPGIGLRIRTLREEKGLTQQDLGNILSVNKSAISHYERDKRNIPIDTLIKISNFFDVDIKYILGINNEGISDDKKIRMSNEEIDFILEMRKKSNYNNLIINPRKYAKLIELKTIDYNSKI